jgi:hypothetical protein
VTITCLKNLSDNGRFVDDFDSAVTRPLKREEKKLVFELFPYGYVKQAYKIAGMKRLRVCSTD